MLMIFLFILSILRITWILTFEPRIHIVIASCNDSYNVKKIMQLAPEAEYYVYDKCSSNPEPGVISLKNVGRDYHTFLYHIIQNYDELPNGKIIFTAASIQKHDRERRLKFLLNYSGDAFCDHHSNQKLEEIWSDWTKSRYDGKLLDKATPRGFKSWCLYHLCNIDTSKKRCGNGIFLTTGRRIRMWPINFYMNLMVQLEVGNAPEAVHYIERVTSHIFAPDEPFGEALQFDSCFGRKRKQQ